MARSLSRRALVLGAAGSALTACGSRRASTDPLGPVKARLVDGSFRSSAMGGRRTGWSIAYPPGRGPGDKLPVVVSLHGRDGTHANTFDQLHLDSVLDDLVDDGIPPFAIASVDGGAHSYWHARADGTDASAMLRDEFLPLLKSKGLDTSRLGLYGWSMGGYGALLLAGTHRVPLKAVAVSSSALFTSAGATAAGAFDDAADFDDHDVYASPGRLSGLQLRVDCGRSDPFYRATRDFVARLRPHPAGAFPAGEHNATFWRKVAPAQLRFLGQRL